MIAASISIELDLLNVSKIFQATISIIRQQKITQILKKLKPEKTMLIMLEILNLNNFEYKISYFFEFNDS